MDILNASHPPFYLSKRRHLFLASQKLGFEFVSRTIEFFGDRVGQVFLLFKVVHDIRVFFRDKFVKTLLEIFYSIQGESTQAGRPCIFIRLTGCKLRCTYCDTQYSYFEGNPRRIEH